MMSANHTKILNTDASGKNRLKFTSSKQIAKLASADVYRSYKRKSGVVTSASSREEQVHRQQSKQNGIGKRLKPNPRPTDEEDGQKIDHHTQDEDVSDSEEKEIDHNYSLFASELDITSDRNASTIFGKFYREIWSLCRSLPEVLHHSSQIVDLLSFYLVSPSESAIVRETTKLDSDLDDEIEADDDAEQDDDISDNHSEVECKQSTNVNVIVSQMSDTNRTSYVVNHATTDILHLVGVLARDLRHEIHPYVHTKLLPRILIDLLNPPPHVDTSTQPIQLDVNVVEAAFRTLSYIFKYDSDRLLAEGVNSDKEKNPEPCLEPMRKYYGITLANKRELVRRLASESFAGLIRKLKTDSAQRKHLRRVVKALAASSIDNQKCTSPSALRLQQDAVDGIARLFFEVARGVPGQLHSKGYSVAIRTFVDFFHLKKNVSNHESQQLSVLDVVYNVAAEFMKMLSHYLSPSCLDSIISKIITSTTLSIKSRMDFNDIKLVEMKHILDLINLMISFRKSGLLAESKEVKMSLDGLLELVLDEAVYNRCKKQDQESALRLFCTAAEHQTEDLKSLKRMSEFIQNTLTESFNGMSDDLTPEGAPIFFLLHNLIPKLSSEMAMSVFGSKFVTAAAKVAEKDWSLALKVLYGLSITKPLQPCTDIEEVDDSDDLFFPDRAAFCRLPDGPCEILLKIILRNIDNFSLSIENASCLSAHFRAVSFVALLGSENLDSGRQQSNYKKVASSFLSFFEKATSDSGYTNDEGSHNLHLVTTMSVAIECFALLSKFVVTQTKSNKLVEKNLIKARPYVERHLLETPKRVWVVKSAAAFVSALKKLEIRQDECSEKLFDSLVSNLSESNHFLRLHTLEILASYPPRTFVVDHADLDLTDDLDEEGPKSDNKNTQLKASPNGACSLLETLLSIESTPIRLNNERLLLSLISRVDVLGRTGKLPVMYAEAASAHLLGLLHVKFEPLWSAAIKTLVALSKEHEHFVWIHLQEQLVSRMEKLPCYEAPSNNLLHHPAPTFDHSSMFSSMMIVETSLGTDVSLFAGDILSAKDGGRVSRHETTDDIVVLQSLWSVIENSPKILLSHSKTIVPIVLKFIRLQYYKSHREDPDAREIELDGVGDDELSDDRQSNLNRKAIHNRLISILKMFRALKGPQQLFKHQTLLPIFVALVGQQDTEVAQVAFGCMLKFKPEHVMSYAETINDFFEKGKLRHAMMRFKSNFETNKLERAEKKSILTLLARVLFGRLSSRTASSKDSPASRRIAILNFLSSVCENDEDLYPFMYLMLRVFLPGNFSRKPIEKHSLSDRSHLLGGIRTISVNDCLRLPLFLHQGFLNALESVLSQFGHRVKDYVPSFMSIILIQCKAFEVKGKVDAEDEEVAEHGVDGNEGTVRAGTVRSLCYRRLCDIFKKFSGSFSFLEYSQQLWNALQNSIHLLPEMTSKCARVPSLLSLLNTISEYPSLVGMLHGVDEVIHSVILCLNPSCTPPIVESILSFLENLLEYELSNNKQSMIQKHVLLLLIKFQARISTFESLSHRRNKFRGRSSPPRPNLRRELKMLCKISNFLDFEGGIDSAEAIEICERLCVLLIQFLNLTSGISDDERIIITELLDKLSTNVSPAVAAQLFEKLSTILGPYKSKCGITSKIVRSSVASSLFKISSFSYSVGLQASGVALDLCAVNTKKVDEVDYDKILAALNTIGSSSETNSWSSLCNVQGQEDASLLLPIVCCNFHILYSDDGVVSRGAFKALQSLMVCAAEKVATTLNSEGLEPDVSCLSWMKLLSGTIMPALRSGLSSLNIQARRFYILLIREAARSFEKSSSSNFYGDLSCLVNDEEPDLDFFVNITHVQIHRHTKAMQRLRKVLSVSSQATSISSISLSNILLPIATHPVYETKMKIEENVALEAIATVGAISRHLTWRKYYAILWTHLNQFNRNPEQEKYLIGLICAIIDGFHFEIESADTLTEANSVWRALENRIIPKIQTLLIKEKVDNKGTKVKILRSSVILALMKLFGKFPDNIFHKRLPQLLSVVCSALTSRDSNARDVARVTVSKMVIEMDMIYLPDVLRDLKITLNEGYKLHVLIATVHTILLDLSNEYCPPASCTCDISAPAFDKSVPAFMDLIQQDIYGEAQDRNDADGSQVRYVKEAGGSKALHSLELLSRMICFKPSLGKVMGVSSVHALIMPLLERLRSPDLPTKALRRTKEGLSRVANGLLRNPTLFSEELLPFIRSTLESFIQSDIVMSVVDSLHESIDSEDDEPLRSIDVSSTVRLKITTKPSAENMHSEVAEWRPSLVGNHLNAKSARLNKLQEQAEISRVRDGRSAPRLTGSSRLSSSGVHWKSLNDPSIICAVTFNLQLLTTVLKKTTKFVASDEDLDHFVFLLTTCFCRSRDAEVITLSMRCLGSLLGRSLPSLHRCSQSLASKTLDLLVGSGSNQELIQASYKMLTYLINLDHHDRQESGHNIEDFAIEERESMMFQGKSISLRSNQMQVLVSFLLQSIVDFEHHNAATGLIKAIMNRRYLSPEFYDLMEKVLEQAVRNPNAPARDQFSKIFVRFLIDYPLSSDRMEDHLKQIVLNLNYEYSEGRLSVIQLVNQLYEKLPEELIEEKCQMFFIPLSLQLVNDDSKECREAVAGSLMYLLKRLSTTGLQSLFTFTEKWSRGSHDMCRMSLQLFSIFIEARPDFIKRGDHAANIVENTVTMLEQKADHWEIVYFSLIVIEKLTNTFDQVVTSNLQLWQLVVPTMANSHPWIRLVSSRLVAGCLMLYNPVTFPTDKPDHFLMSLDASLYRIAHNLCLQLDSDEEQQRDELTATNVKLLTWMVQAMKSMPQLCFTTKDTTEKRDPVNWLMTRLANIAKQKGNKRRQGVFKCYAAFATFCGAIAFDYLELMLEPLHRCELEAWHSSESQMTTTIPNADGMPEEAQLAKEVLFLLEEKCDSHEHFLKAYAAVKTKAQDKKTKRKNEIKTEAVIDPVNAAKRRIKKQEHEKSRRKRRVDDNRNARSATAKRKHT